MAARGPKVAVLTIDPARRLADSLGLDELGNVPVRVELGEHGRGGGELWATMLDAKATFDEVDRSLCDRREGPATGPRQPHLPADLRRARRLAGVHGDGEALRARRGGRLRPARPRHPAVAERARLPRRPAPGHAVRRGAGDAPVHPPHRLRGPDRRARVLGRLGGPAAGHRRRSDRRPVGVLLGDGGAAQRLSGPRRARRGAARRRADHVPGRHLARRRADRGGRLPARQARRGRLPARGDGRQPRSHDGRARRARGGLSAKP